MKRTVSVVTSSEIGTKFLFQTLVPENQHPVAELDEELRDVSFSGDLQVIYLVSVVYLPYHVENRMQDANHNLFDIRLPAQRRAEATRTIS